MGKRTLMGKPPDKGSFPIDHFGECTELKAEYLRCLQEYKHDNMSCRYISKQYLECRMNNNLMQEESMTKLGFNEEEDKPKAPRKRDRQKTKEENGWIVGVDGIKPQERKWTRPTMFKLPWDQS
eukprot:gnl/TRDRNA2_/TRDRNA2_94230_c0_seq1.p1 gnl/TRDRNA2_/TRDRNA2_94230_c0~~gnl/TRDRNA2_/TRDRNA2_94230_c0_seq1.p1  ORF type:complete len:124 (-),score=28.52 gnl/TRDRNA2_/TRDRNA2_94230_c0_seq1:108-479(-)